MRTWTWSKPATWPMTRRVFVTMLAVTYLPLGYVLYGWGEPAAAPAPTETVVNHYESPCAREARVSRNIPQVTVDSSTGLAAYVQAHLQGSTPDAELADYWAALDHCDATQPVAKFDYAHLYLVSSEVVR